MRWTRRTGQDFGDIEEPLPLRGRKRALQAQNEGDQRLQIGAAGGNAGHADRAGVSAGPLEKKRNRFRIESRARQVGRVVGSFAVRAVALVAFISKKARLTLRN